MSYIGATRAIVCGEVPKNIELCCTEGSIQPIVNCFCASASKCASNVPKMQQKQHCCRCLNQGQSCCWESDYTVTVKCWESVLYSIFRLGISGRMGCAGDTGRWARFVFCFLFSSLLLKSSKIMLV